MKKLNLKRKLKAFMDKICQKSINSMLLECFPKITEEEAKELLKLLEDNEEKGEKY